MKKVLIINTTLNKGGAARIAHNLFENLNSDFEMFFAYGREKNILKKNTFYFGNKLEVLIHVFLVRFLGLEGLGSYFSTRKLINYIKKEKFDLVNLHNLHGYYVNFSSLLYFLNKSKIPIIYSLHDEWSITWLPAHSLGCDHCKSGIGECINTYQYPKNYFPLFTKYMLKIKKKVFNDLSNLIIICPSNWLKESIQNSFLNKFKIQVINNGVDINIFKPILNKDELKIKYNLPLNKKIILFSASNLNDTSKGVSHIIDTAKILTNKNYLFVGLGKGNIQNSINLKTFGYIYNNKVLSEIYALSDIFCFTSTAETFLLSAAEALSCGIPVVGFDIPVVRELVSSRVGVLTMNNNKSLSDEINHLINDKDRIIEMGKLGRELIVGNYSNKIFYKNYIDAYNNILNI